MPELICPDRRHGTLRMYTTSNLNPVTYLAAKVIAAWSVLAIVTVIPVVIMLLSYSLFGHGPSNVGDWFKTLAQIVSAGLELAIFYGTIALAISSLTDRNSFAAAGIILTFVLSGAALGILQGPLKAPAWIALVNVNELPSELVLRIYQVKAFVSSTAASLPTWEVAAAAAGWVIAGLAVLAARYIDEGRR
jgi:ABC-2 type transport system permease protein